MAKEVNLGSRLKGSQKRWKNSAPAYEETYGDSLLPVGNYHAKLEKVEIKDSKAGELMCYIQFVVIGGKCDGKKIKRWISKLETNDKALVQVRRFVEKMDYEQPDNIEDLPELIEQISEEGADCEVNISHYEWQGEERQNAAILRVLEENEEYEYEGEDESPEEEEEEKEEEEEEKEEEEEEEEKEEEEEEKEEEVDELEGSLRDFCEANDIAVDAEDGSEVLAEKIAAYDWPQEQMSEDEIQMFKDAGIESAISKPKAAKKTKVDKKKKETKKEEPKKTTGAKKATKSTSKKTFKKKKK